MATVMIVDDEPKMVTLINDILVSNEYETILAGNGKEALEKLEEKLPDLILLDIMMPDIDGIELCMRIKTNPDMSHIPVVMVTGKRDLESQMDAIYTEADGYITKPFGVDELLEEVSNFLSREKSSSLLNLKEDVRIDSDMDEHIRMDGD